MKIHKIETVNLNSLYGPQTVDLDATLAGDSLFLIYGPTGSGKSTLMDAVSLALFGVTPRLNAEHGNASADPRAVMSRGTGKCSATVVFSKLEAGAREVYRATWMCRRAYEKPDRDWQRATRSVERLAADGDWELMVSSDKRKVWTPVFDKVLEGFGVRDFNRSMLLAQGQFDAFLGAPPDQRAEILERLTDTSIYQRLGQRASRIRGRHTNRLTALRTLAAAGGGLEADALQELEQTHAQLTGEHHGLQKVHEQAAGHLRWFNVHVEFLGKLVQTEGEKKKLAEDAAEAAPVLARLATHELCEGEKAFQLLDRHVAVQKQVTDLQGKIDAIVQSLPGLEEATQTKERDHAGAVARAGAAVSQIEALRPLAEATDKANVAATAAAGLAQETAAGRRAAELRAKTHEEELEQARKAVAEAKGAAETARADLVTHAADGELAAAWGPIRTRLDKVVANSERLGSDASALTKRDEELTRDRGSLAQDQAKHQESHETELKPAQQAAEKASLALAALQSQVDFETSRAEAVGTVESRRIARDAVQAAKPSVSAARTGAAKLEVGREQVESLAGEIDRERVALVALAQEVALRAEGESRADAAWDRTKRVAALVEHRVALVEGESCPLCGSEEHPWAYDSDRSAADAEINETLAEAELARDQARTAHKSAERAHRKAESGAQALAAKLELLRDQHGQAASQQAELDSRATSDLTAAGLGPKATVDVVDKALQEATRLWSEARVTLDTLDAARRKVDDADKLLRAAVDASKEAETVLREGAAALKERGQRLEAARGEHAGAVATQQLELIACAAVLRDHGLEPVGDDPSQWRALGDARCEAHEARVKRVTELDAQVTTLETARVGKEELLSGEIRQRDELVTQQGLQEADRDKKRSDAARARSALDEEWKAVGRVDPGRDPDTLPAPDSAPAALIAAQKTWVERTAAAAKKTATDHGTAVAALEDARTRRKTLDEQRTELETARVEARVELDAALEALELGGEAALVAVRLDDGLLIDLRAKKKKLDDRRVEVQTRMVERREQLEAHTLSRPEELSEEPDLEELAAAVAASKEGADEAAKACQKTGDRLRDHHRAVTEQKANRDALRDAEEEARVWQTLHQFIGVNDGGKFKEFAQALNLGQLLDKANVHMARLSKRYLLIPRLDEGLPTLEFDLSDLHQAGERVAPRSLSGGERFLVSLSLALGLSDFRAVKMPIETLLLDEGFGTLDQDTLSVALGALSQLRADGRQVGIISHVVGLRERIEARIEVRPLGGGRSEAIPRG